jgi:hypothetical protein
VERIPVNAEALSLGRQPRYCLENEGCSLSIFTRKNTLHAGQSQAPFFRTFPPLPADMSDHPISRYKPREALKRNQNSQLKQLQAFGDAAHSLFGPNVKCCEVLGHAGPR